ncbi:FadR/GntR family transcriptional regulator [Megasphaera paucivorans]|uniref:Pyruvate dehydrogenase complex repressor n=1 Tax=Megasphaera paucivorans TaxID=349095 RepID=A0A1G9STW1_9FIRM|nr:FadR/GntR family transcriptional regulator [Megasphaera paucivorans]SDM38882.1 DNA-binding transcriptional regulator, FadR family [Megasphaera paucivorans]
MMREFAKKSLVEKTAHKISMMIADKAYAAGQKLPNEYELSRYLGVGRNTIREAVRSLVSRNILVIKQGAGTFVSKKMGIADDPLGFMFVENKDKVLLDLIEVRFILEPPIASLAAQNASLREIHCLGRTCQEMEDALAAGQDPTDKDIEFHTQIATCSNNLVVPRLVPVINTAIKAFTSIEGHKVVAMTLSHHREIYEAIRDHRSYDAQDAMMLHLAYNRNKIRKNIFDKT